MKAKKILILLIVLAVFTISGCLKNNKFTNLSKTPQPSATESPEKTPEVTPEPTATAQVNDFTKEDIVSIFNSKLFSDENNYTVVCDERVKEIIITPQMQQNIDAKVVTELTRQTDNEGKVTIKADADTSANGTITKSTSYFYNDYCYESALGEKYKYSCSENDFLATYFSIDYEDEEVFLPEYIESFTTKKDGKYTVVSVKLNHEKFFDSAELGIDEIENLTSDFKFYLTADNKIDAVECIIKGKGNMEMDDLKMDIDFDVSIKVTVVTFKPFELPTDLDTYEEIDFSDYEDII